MVDYSKWKDIDISDAEDDEEPKINNEALFLWREQAWVERLEVLVRGEEDIKEKRKSIDARLVDIKERISAKDGDEVALKKELEKVEKEGKKLDRVENDMMLKEKKAWDVDKIDKSFFEKIGITKSAGRKPDEELSLEEFEEFVKENEELCKQYGMLRKYEDSKRFLEEHQQLVCEETCCYLTNWCIDLEVEKKHELVDHLAHQCVCMQYILELGERLGVDPRACVSSFFSRTQLCLPEYLYHFENDVKEYKKRVQDEAQEKIQAAKAKVQDVQSRLGPGGLDPLEVYESLPEEVQAGFTTCDTELLVKLFDAMPWEVANYHHQRCLASGLWLLKDADGAAGKDAAATNAAAADATAAATATATTAATADSSAAASADAITTATAAATAAADDAKEEPIYTGVSTEDLDLLPAANHCWCNLH
ncbi:hsp90 co-chaperone Cdc37-like isoform X2 [Drosophila miranda]|uniref:hsp90 co-chaperone Cdc37-like isoform X2 n=1 Tax=Drosophila miranda TaxID=7229 RepID=UPI00143FAC11|nr:hsp90 co-chaperone Cdc37-like isoform X2 [Drosophila miranda]